MIGIEWGWAGRALDVLSGDMHVVVPLPSGALVALIDGLGHGPEAAAAAMTAAPVLEANAADPVLTIMQRCHEVLRKTRGAVMSLAVFSTRPPSVTWTGVGNVAGTLLRGPATVAQGDRALFSRPGVVGYQLPPLHAETLEISRGDILVFASDGIKTGFTTGLTKQGSPQEIAEGILARFGKDSDDAHVVVARYLGDEA